MAEIRFDAERRLLAADTPHTTYLAALGEGDTLLHRYWGPRLTPEQAAAVGAADLTPRPFEAPLPSCEEYPVEGGLRYGPPALAARLPGGVRSVEWRLAGHTVAGREAALRFTDRTHPLAVTLHYRVHDDADVIERWVTAENTSDDEVIELARLDSAAWTMPNLPGHRLSHLYGRWGAETQLERVPLAAGETVLTSRRGVTSHHANPWFAVDDGTATEEHGDVYGGALAWSGSWRIVLARQQDGTVQAVGGAGHEGFGPYVLAPRASLSTPVFAGLYTADGFGGASRSWHAYALRHVLPNAEQVRPVLYNSWEATEFDLDEANQRALAERAAALGAELFVVDDGWFGARTGDHAGLGDWTPNPDRFPDGLGPLIAEVHRLGMGFGIWVEPEMVNPDSDLYREHPDWVYHWPDRTRHELRHQLVLNLARPDVAEWLHDTLHRLLSDNDIAFVKWDMNRPVSEPGWPEETTNPQRLWIDHTRNLYAVLDRLRAEHPGVAFESCSSGGGRIDLGVLARTDQVWTSDNTDAGDRLVIQHGYSQLYPARAMTCWVTDVPNFLTGRSVSLRYRFHVAMTGVLGVGGDLARWDDAELAEAADLVAAYKRIRHVVQHGELYRLRPPDGGVSAVQYVTADRAESVLLAFRDTARVGEPAAPLRLAGLDPDALYRPHPDAGAAAGPPVPGRVLMHRGVSPALPSDHSSALLHLVRTHGR